MSVSKFILHPFASTFVPAGVFGHLSLAFKTPSLSVSKFILHPFTSTFVPAGVFGHLSFVLTIPSPSLSRTTGVLTTTFFACAPKEYVSPINVIRLLSAFPACDVVGLSI